jgi:hypothetical protein
MILKCLMNLKIPDVPELPEVPDEPDVPDLYLMCQMNLKYQMNQMSS